MIGAKPTAEQVAALEKAHKMFFVMLVQAGMFRISLARKFGLKSPQFLNYNKIYVPLVEKFARRQVKLQVRAGIPEIVELKGLLDAFFTSKGIAQLAEVAKTYDRAGKGIGIIPLIIWAVIAIVGAFSAVEIVDETNTSNEEVQELVVKTGDFCKANNLSPDQCKSLLQEEIKSTTSESGGFLSSLLKPLLFLGAGYLIVTNWDKITGSTKKAAA